MDSYYQRPNRNLAARAIDYRPQPFPLRLQCLTRRGDIQIAIIATFKVPVVSECVPQKVQAGPGTSKVNHLRFIPVQLQAEPGLNLCLDILTQPATLAAGQHHKVIRITNNLRLGPITRATGGVENLIEPMKVYISQKRRNNSALCKVSNYAKYSA
jgi:hypothetical protein